MINYTRDVSMSGLDVSLLSSTGSFDGVIAYSDVLLKRYSKNFNQLAITAP